MSSGRGRVNRGTDALTALRRRRWRETLSRRVKVVTTGGVVVLLAVYLLYFSPFFEVKHVAISGETSLSEASIRAAARVPVGQPLLNADLGAIQARLDAIPAVASAAVSRSWPQTVSIVITERIPVAVVASGSGFQDIDASGVLFDSFTSRPAGLPLITLAGSVDRSALRNAVTVAASLPSKILSQVTSITVHTMDDIQLDLSGGRWIQWGNSNDSAVKAQIAVALLQRAAHVDVSVPSNPVTQ